MIRLKDDFIELDVIVEKYITRLVCVRNSKGKPMKDEDGKNIKEKIEKYNGFQVVPTNFAREGITLYGPVTNDKNKLLKTRSTIYDKFTNKFFVVNHRTEEIEKSLKTNNYKPIGFKLRANEVH